MDLLIFLCSISSTKNEYFLDIIVSLLQDDEELSNLFVHIAERYLVISQGEKKDNKTSKMALLKKKTSFILTNSDLLTRNIR